MKTTLNKIRAHGPCGMDPRTTPLVGFCKLRDYLGHGFDPDTEFSILTVLDSNGLDDALWCLRAVDGHEREMRLYAVWCARQVQHLSTDPRVSDCLDVAERFANGEATDQERDSAWDSAEAAARDSARDSAWAAAWAAARDSAWDSARDSAWDSAEAAARDSAWAAAWAAARAAARAVAWDSARAAAWAAAWAAARAAARAVAWDSAEAAQEQELRRLCAHIAATEGT